MSDLYRFKSYANRQKYTEATGMEAPPYDPGKPPKHWVDPTPDIRTLYQQYTVIRMNNEGNPFRLDADDLPQTEPLSIRTTDAPQLNLPDLRITGQMPIPKPVPLPIRNLEENEELMFIRPTMEVIIRKV